MDLRAKFSSCDSGYMWRDRALWLERQLQNTLHALQRERAGLCHIDQY
jgi:hypothetical protein